MEDGSFMRNTDWTLANCTGHPTSMHPPNSARGRSVVRFYDEYLSLCNDCPIRGDCLNAAMTLEENSHGHRHGIWGGTTPDMRTVLYLQWKGMKWLPRQRSGTQSDGNSPASLTSGSEEE